VGRMNQEITECKNQNTEPKKLFRPDIPSIMRTLTELTAEYYDLIGGEHHKDKDCHFYIEKIYSYGREPYWQFCHYGYCWSVENFFQDEANVEKYQEFYNKQKKRFDYLQNQKTYYSSCKNDFYLTQFPDRQIEQEAEQDMKNFLEWAIEKEKKNQLKQGNDGWGF